MATNQPQEPAADVGVVGLGVMGRNLALNMADHGYTVAGFDLDSSAVETLIEEDRAETPDGKAGSIVGCSSMESLVRSLREPRVVVVLVPAGKAVDAVCESLIDAGIEEADIVVDAGNSRWTDTIDREQRFRGKLVFFGSGVSGGEVGARFGPSLMPGGDPEAWERLQPIWEAVAAKVDPETGRPLVPDPERPGVHGIPGKPVEGGEPCAAYIGPNGAGHYVKMVHNGIEYADMQLICEAFDLMRRLAGLTPDELGDVFAQWNGGDLESYLIEITADILRQSDPDTGKPFVDVVLDRAEQKGTGRWTAINALEMGVPATAIAEAVFARAISALKDERTAASSRLKGPPIDEHRSRVGDREEFIHAVRDALYCSKICAYAQGFQLMRAAQEEYDWDLEFAEIARIWRGGCIIRARFLQKIAEAFSRDESLANLLLDPYFAEEMERRQANWRRVASTAVSAGIPTPAFSASLAYFDSYRTETLPANLLQAQRDYFGAHSYERVDQPRGKHFHLDWPEPDRPQIEV